jgi:hypothetical protein
MAEMQDDVASVLLALRHSRDTTEEYEYDKVPANKSIASLAQ